MGKNTSLKFSNKSYLLIFHARSPLNAIKGKKRIKTNRQPCFIPIFIKLHQLHQTWSLKSHVFATWHNNLQKLAKVVVRGYEKVRVKMQKKNHLTEIHLEFSLFLRLVICELLTDFSVFYLVTRLMSDLLGSKGSVNLARYLNLF